MTAKLPVRKIVIAGVMSAIAVFLGATRLGFIPWFVFSITIMHIPVIIGAVLEGPIVGLIIGFFFGLWSLIQAAVAPNTPGDTIFVNPLISILPRLLIGPAAWLVYRAVRKLNEYVSLFLAGIAGSLTNTIFVLGILGLFVIGPESDLTWKVLGGVVVTSGFIEAAAAAVLTTAVVAAWKGIERGRKKSRLEEEDAAEE